MLENVNHLWLYASLIYRRTLQIDLVYNGAMTELEQAYQEGESAERARIIKIIRGFKVIDMEFPETGRTVSFPTEDLVSAINGE